MINRLLTGRYDKKLTIAPTKIVVLLLTTLSLSGCLTTPVKLSQANRHAIKSIRIATVEAPPLQIIPDQLQERMPVYVHYDNMVLPVNASTTLYRQRGGIVVAGLVGEGDSVDVIEPEDKKHDVEWSPALLLQREAVRLLNDAKFQIKAANDGVDADAVLELVVGQYRIFEGQIALQVLMKLIDAKTGAILAHFDEKSTAYEAPIPVLLANDGSRFKSALRKTTTQLLAKGFHDIGLTYN